MPDTGRRMHRETCPWIFLQRPEGFGGLHDFRPAPPIFQKAGDCLVSVTTTVELHNHFVEIACEPLQTEALGTSPYPAESKSRNLGEKRRFDFKTDMILYTEFGPHIA